MIKTKKKFFFVCDIIQMKILLTSKQNIQLISFVLKNATLIVFLKQHILIIFKDTA